jgi:predicted amidophosphoribosyltransferase
MTAFAPPGRDTKWNLSQRAGTFRRMRIATGLAGALGSGCVVCRRTGAALCSACAAACEPVKVVAPVDGLDRVLAPWAYEGAPRDLILALKLRGRRAAAEPLIDAIVRTAQSAALGAEVVTWVPGRPSDIRIRGYDHAEVLARGVAKRLGLPAHPLIRRVADPPDQTTLTAEQRHRNLKGAFVATTWPGKAAVVDDLVTTGATLTACAGALRATGATGVEGLVPCRA